MATKAKTEPASKTAPLPPPAASFPLAAAFAKAIKLVDTGKHAEAAKALEALIQEALATGDWVVVDADRGTVEIHPQAPARGDKP